LVDIFIWLSQKPKQTSKHVNILKSVLQLRLVKNPCTDLEMVIVK